MDHLLSGNSVTDIDISDLRLDANNPRFGQLSKERRNQTDILDFIVETFGVEDVLSSLSVNGYFAAEPLVCRTNPDEDGTYVVAEGNRRLAACLILLGEDRAKNQAYLTKKYQEIHARHGSPKIDKIPALIVDAEANNKSLLSYLGVRHIAAARAWDSYAKAVWIHRVVTESGISLEDAAAMIGDEHKTLARLLEGYHFILQLQEERRFKPENSVRRGRGSNTAYPFSWVYTILGYGAARQFTGINDDPERARPIPEDKLDNAELLIRSMFGDSARGINSALTDSRQIPDLAAAVDNEEKIALLKQGKSIEQIKKMTEPLEERLSSGLFEAKELLGDLNNRLTEEKIGASLANKFTGHSGRVKNLAGEVDKRLHDAAGDS